MSALSLITVRDAVESDMEAITAIYAWHVIHGCGSFEETPPDSHEIALRYQKVLSHALPWLCAARGDQVVGYCYATQYRPRPAYRFTLENSVYIHPDFSGQGIGTLLMNRLIERCNEAGYHQMLAIIGDGENNQGSFKLHKNLGFDIAGNFRSVGFKQGKWRDTLLMQKTLTPSPQHKEG
ncbi:GNAT family N-acetyltransferase [Erwinia sp. ErVv1]|uniref:GNAT family N-acetyltransferase n=1 Tax=Erwinia sp. ErVv1 TaxID=1603299 RepID=UPI00082E04BE|nr:GNAT family N-acetyltransferase [Erwinia sp. ErVv1]